MFKWWKRWKRRTTRSTPDRPTGERSTLPPYSIVACTLSDVGCRRTVNEDRIRYVAPGATAAPERGALLVVADGMGGHAAGEVASQLAVDYVCQSYYASLSDALPQAALETALHTANQAIHDAAAREDRLQGMGTTCTALALQHGRAYCAYVGDSRLYLIRAGGLYTMSEDHSLTRQMVKEGLLTPHEAQHHHDKHVVVRALGTRPEVAVSTWPAPLSVHPEDRLLLCSDGLSDLVEEDEIRQTALEADPPTACRRLVAQARARGGHDNISVGLLYLEPAQPVARTAAPTRTVEVL